MRRIIERPFLDYLKPNLHEVDSVAYNLPALIRWKRVINPFNFMLGLIGLSLVVGIFSNIALSFCIGLIGFMCYSYIRTRSLAKKLYVSRELNKKKLFQSDDVIVTYKLVNASLATSPPMRIRDLLSFSDQPNRDLEVPFLLPARSHRSLELHLKADGGMGVRRVGPLSLTITDPFGIFEFSVLEDDEFEVEVLPRIGEVPELRLKGAPHSNRYGIYDVQSIGSSVNFVGVREYEQGDSLRNIAWKLSAKRGELFVKEFESMVNAEIALFLNLRPNIHQGAPGYSTWELTKDIALSLVTQQVANSNSVRVFTQQFFIENLRGQQDTYELAQQLLKVDPLRKYLDGTVHHDDEETSPSSADLLHKYVAMQRPGSNVILITPFLTYESTALISHLKGLREMGCEVFVILIDSQSYFTRISKRVENSMKFSSPTMTGVDRFADQLSVMGVHVAIIDSEQSIADSLLKMRVAL